MLGIRCCLPVLFLAVMTGAPSVKVVVLGIAQDGGIPQIGCTQEICRTQHHFVSSLAILTDGSLFLIDATPDLREQHRMLLERYPDYAKKNLFDGIFLTHAHMGHYTGLMYLGKESVSTKDLPVYCSEEMASLLRKNAPWSLLVSNGNIELHAFRSGEELKLNGFSVTPLSVPHRKEFTDTHGFLIHGSSKTLLYIPDIDSWDPVREPMKEWLQKANYALLDGTFYSGDELPGRNIQQVPHPTIQASIAFFHSLGLLDCRIYFVHLNHTNPILDPQTPQWAEFQKTPYKVAAEWQEFDL